MKHDDDPVSCGKDSKKNSAFGPRSAFNASRSVRFR
jgi:hypothetical protein